MDFGEILSKAWKIIWKYKILWVFGILASFGQSSGGGGGGGGNSSGNFNGNSSDFSFDPNNLSNMTPEMQHYMQQVSDIMAGIQWWMIALVIIGLLVISLVFWAISIMGKTGLILGTQKGDGGADRLSFGELWSSSMHYFWRVLGFSLLTGIAIFIIVLIMMLPMILAIIGTLGIATLCIVPFICILVPAMLLLNIILEQGTIAIIVEDIGIMDGLQRGWLVFKANFWNMILMAIILGVMSGVIGFIISLPLIIAILPGMIALIGSSAAGTFDMQAVSTAGLVTLGLCCLIYPFVLIFNGVLVAYVQSAWTLTYMRLTNRPAPVFSTPEIPGEVPPLPNQL